MSPSNFISLLDQHFGRLHVIGRAPNTPSGRTRWQCLCVCGTHTVVLTGLLRAGKTTSCGCLHREQWRRIVTKHGRGRTPEYRVYHGMRDRCLNANAPAFRNYGGRGITILWQSFEEFVRDMGPRPSPKHSIERLDNNGPYSKENCVWATRGQQSNNTRRNHRVEYQGALLTLRQIADQSGLPYGTVKYRVKRGISLILPHGYRRKPVRK
jgi:hypothetical protein